MFDCGMAYVLGLQRLGHEVYAVEDIEYCWDAKGELALATTLKAEATALVVDSEVTKASAVNVLSRIAQRRTECGRAVI